MLGALRQIVQEVNEARDLGEVLRVMVSRVSSAMSVEACSVYLADHTNKHFVLAASIGFLDGADGQVKIQFDEGLVGLVGEREEPINVSHAPEHPRYRYFPQTGEERYLAFLGVPIIHQRKLVGILVVQQRQPRRFDEGEVAFLVTISAQIAGYITDIHQAGVVTLLNTTASHHHLQGVAGSPGVAVGTACVVMTSDLVSVTPREILETEIAEEIQRLESAIDLTRSDIEGLKRRLHPNLLPEEHYLFDAYLSILDSQSIRQDIITLINERHWAPWALRKIIKRQVHKFEAMEDPYLRERAYDILDLGRRVLANLKSEHFTPQTYPKDTILVGDDVSASMLAEVPYGHLVGVVSGKGSANAHVAILARAIGIPAVMGVKGLYTQRLEGKKIVIDGYSGEVFTAPTPAMIKDFQKLAQEEEALYRGLDELKDLPAETPDGFRVSLCANAAFVADIRPALSSGAEGVGLSRTEVPFMIRDRFPGEEEQYLIYRQLLESFSPKPVVFRTLDIGGDKFLPYFPVKEENPYLGWRGIRLTLDHPEIFLVQLRAMLRASHGLNNLQILFPMISNYLEVEEAIRLTKQAYREVLDEGSNIQYPKIGAMIEVPAAVYLIHDIVKRVDFVSVGSNDLTQYILAVDRNNVHVANLYDHLHPAVISALKAIVEGAHAQHKPVSMCGEMASDPCAIIILIALGFDMCSMSAHNVNRAKWIIRNFTREKANRILNEVLQISNPKAVRAHLESALDACGMGGLVRVGHH